MKIDVYHDPFVKGGYLYHADGNRWFSLAEDGIRKTVTVSDLADGILQKSILKFEPAAALPMWAVCHIVEIHERDWQEVLRKQEEYTKNG